MTWSSPLMPLRAEGSRNPVDHRRACSRDRYCRRARYLSPSEPAALCRLHKVFADPAHLLFGAEGIGKGGHTDFQRMHCAGGNESGSFKAVAHHLLELFFSSPEKLLEQIELLRADLLQVCASRSRLPHQVASVMQNTEEKSSDLPDPPKAMSSAPSS
jgi:hypothetical protein